MAKATMGRPTKYSQEIADAICEHITSGKSLRSICQRDDMPSTMTVLRWLADESKKDFCLQYAYAREAQADAVFDDCIDIADNATSEEVQQARLRIDTRKWMAGKLRPKKYSDKLTVAGDADNPIAVTGQLITKIEVVHVNPSLGDAG
jgi:hypothetical protein